MKRIIINTNNCQLSQTSNPFIKYLIMKIDGKQVAYLSYLLIYDRVEIENLFVSEEYRRKGNATYLMEELFSICKKNNCTNITLEVDVTNRAAISLYKKYSFKVVANRDKYYGNNNGYLMLKEFI